MTGLVWDPESSPFICSDNPCGRLNTEQRKKNNRNYYKLKCFACVSTHYVSSHMTKPKSDCAPSEDSDQPRHPPSLIRVFAVRMKKHWVLSYPLSAQRRL